MSKKIDNILKTLMQAHQAQGTLVDSLDLDDKNREYLNGIRHGLEKAICIIQNNGGNEE